MINKCYIIPVQKKCNCNCQFCISKSRNYNKDVEFLEINSNFLGSLEILKKRGIKKFEITGGGEPLLHKNIDVITKLIKTIIPDSYIKLYTNGTNPRIVGPVDEINVSITHYDTKINDEFMRPIDIGTTGDLFGRLCQLSKNPGAKLRLSIPLVKGAIDSKEKLKDLINETKNWVSEYVVRTLYPGCPNYEELYVDFDYKDKRVVFERDNNVSDFSSIVLWSDGKLYTDFELNKERYMYSYMLFKPDSRIYINEIDNFIRENNFDVKKRLLVNDFVSNATKLYLDKEKEYLELVKRHLMNSARLFGDEGLVYVLDKDVSFDALVKDTFDLKVAIRNNFGFTGHYGGYVNFEGENYHLNLVHAPDAVVDYYNRDLNVIENFSSTRELGDDEFSLVKKYRSYNL